MSEPDPLDRRIEAAAWAVRLDAPDCTGAERQTFEAWRADPLNGEAWRRLQSTLSGVESLRSDPDIQSLRLATRRKVVARSSGDSRAWRVGALAAAACTVAAFGLWWSLNPLSRVYETEIGAPESIELADGSDVRLDADSRLVVQYRPASRDLILERGQALFDVAPDVERPFTVSAGASSVTALGTVFDVQRLGTGARIVLVEGVVRVKQSNAATSPAWTLKAGEAVTVGRGSTGPVATDSRAATRWVDGWRVFDQTPLPEAVAALNRHGRETIVLDGAGWAGLRITGSFRVDDARGFAGALSDVYQLDMAQSGDGALRLTRRDTSDPATRQK